jgi:hypothetical protein
MRDDTAGLMGALRIERAHVLVASMGGMIFGPWEPGEADARRP